MFQIVRKSGMNLTSKSMDSRKRKSSNPKAKVRYIASHRVYGIPFGKDQFPNSESTLADKDFVERRQKVFSLNLFLVN